MATKLVTRRKLFTASNKSLKDMSFPFAAYCWFHGFQAIECYSRNDMSLDANGSLHRKANLALEVGTHKHIESMPCCV